MRQVDIPRVQPGEPLDQSLMNQIAAGANAARMVTGDGNILTSQIGGVIGLSQNKANANRNRTALIQIIPTTSIAGGLYNGRIFTQPWMNFQTGTDSGGKYTAMMPKPYPNSNTCYVVNLAEVSPTLYGGTSAKAASNLITSNTLAIGTYIGPMDTSTLPGGRAAAGVPLFAVDIQTVIGASHFTVLIKANGVDGDSWPKYDVYDIADVAMATKLNLAGALVPIDDNGQARWPTRASGAIPVPPVDGSHGTAYYDVTGAIQLIGVPEKLCKA